MSKLNIVRRCHNCGVILQGEDPNAPGYIDPNVLVNTAARVLFCNKCFDESRYNFVPRSPKVSDDFLFMMKDAEASDALIVYVIDLFSFENSFVPEVTDIIEGLNLLIIANKRDLLPANYSDEELREYVAHRFRCAHLACTRDDVILTSLTSMGDSSKIFEEIESRRKRHDVYVIGATGAGKTQLISSLIHSYRNTSSRIITSAPYSGTSLRVMQIPLDTSSYLYETPGIPLNNTVASKLDMEGIATVTPDSAIAARTFTLEPGDVLFLGGLARFELRDGKEQEVRVFVPKAVTVTKARGAKAEDSFFRKAMNKSIRPTSKELVGPADFDVYDLTVEESGSRDIGFAGLGWINFQGDKQTFRIFTPKNVAIYTTRAKIK